MYLEHFQLDQLPFTLTPNTDFFCELPGHKEALNVLLVSIRSGEGFIKIIGEVGTGKTLLCRKVLDVLEPDVVTAYIPNPDLSANGLRKALAKELGLEFSPSIEPHSLLELINQRLLHLHHEGKQVVLFIDEAQALSDQCLEAVRLLTNLETATSKLLQVVLFAQPELDERLKKRSFRQLRQRICFSYRLSPISDDDLHAYLNYRLTKAGHSIAPLFTTRARKLLYKASKGLPRIINTLCHKALMVAYGRGDRQVGHKAMQWAIKDTFASHRPWYWYWLVGGAISLVIVLGVLIKIFS